MTELIRHNSTFGAIKRLQIDEFNSLIVERFYADNENITFQFRNEINQSISEFNMNYIKLIELSNFIDSIIEEAYKEF